MTSRYLSRRELHAFERIGDLMAPGSGDMASFRSTGCAEHVDSVLDTLRSSDRAQLRLLLRILSAVPDRALRALLRALHRSPAAAYPGASIGRTVDIAFRGLVWSLYYSEPASLEAIGYRVAVAPREVLHEGGS